MLELGVFVIHVDWFLYGQFSVAVPEPREGVRALGDAAIAFPENAHVGVVCG